MSLFCEFLFIFQQIADLVAESESDLLNDLRKTEELDSSSNSDWSFLGKIYSNFVFSCTLPQFFF